MAVKKSGLGKGLDSLIPKKSDSAQPASNEAEKRSEKNQPISGYSESKQKTEEIKLKITQIEPNRDQPRKNFDEDGLSELADSIRQYGVIQPLIVTKKDDHYEIIAGERRWRAAKLAGLKEVPVLVKDFSTQEAVEISLIENIQRENLNPIEEAKAYKRLLTEFQLKQDDIAERVSRSRTAVANSLRLLNLDERVQQMVIEEKVSPGHARALLGIADGDTQYRIAQRVVQEKLSVREVERLVKSLTAKHTEKVKPLPADTLIYQDIADKMKSLLGTKVSIEPGKNNKGKIIIDYYSSDDLDRILALFLSTMEN